MDNTKQRVAVITLTPDDKAHQMDIQTGAVTTLEILDMMKALSSFFATQLVNEYKELTGDVTVDDVKFENWVQFLRDSQL